jgi:putative OPT family oligopeptide transporter
MCVVLGAANAYLGLRAGMTIAATYPAAVIGMAVLRMMKGSLLEENFARTVGSIGESVAAGAIFTIPAFVILQIWSFQGFDAAEYLTASALMIVGGILGVLFVTILRRVMVEDRTLPYPESVAASEIHKAGQRGAEAAMQLFSAMGVGALVKLLGDAGVFRASNEFHLAVGRIRESFVRLGLSKDAATISAGGATTFQAPGVSPAYLGVGYIIGPRVAGTIFAGGVFSWFVMMPAIKFFGGLVPTPIYPSTVPIADMTSDQLWTNYIRYIGAGAVAAAGLITLLKTLPTIIAALQAGLGKAQGAQDGASAEGRINRDLPGTIVLGGAAVIVLLLWALLTFKPVPGAPTSAGNNLVASLLVVVFGFLFVTVSSRICGLIGTSANPVSGMTIATLMATCALFLAAGWTTPAYAVLALTIGGVVCIAAANAGATSQDLKTGFLVGATPSAQQLGLFAGVTASAVVIGLTLIGMNKGLERYEKIDLTIDLQQLPEGVVVEGSKVHDGRSFTLLNVIGSKTVPEGKYLADPQSGQVAFQWIQGIGSQAAPAPQARLMSVVINGILNQKLPWGLVFLGVFLVVAVELLGIRSLSFAVGSYLGIGTTAAIFCGGVAKWLAERGMKQTEEGEASPGALYASGLIAAGGIVGLLAIGVKLLEAQGALPVDALKFGPMFGLHESSLVGILAYAALAFSLYHFARKPLEGSAKS